MDFSKERLLELYRPFSDLINGKCADNDGLLDPAICGLLKASYAIVPHSKDIRVLYYHINSRAQPTIFDRKHFKYAVLYDPFGTIGGTPTKNFCVEFYMSKTRIYHEREEMVGRVRRELHRLRLPGFELRENARAFCYDHKFAARSEEDLIPQVRQNLFPLLNAVHPVFFRILDAFNIAMSKEERREIIAGRTKLSYGPRNAQSYGKNMEYHREVPTKLRSETFHRDEFTCQHCMQVFSAGELHADHVIPVARGGLTLLGNLQALCGPCNGRKGKRLESELLR